jgi:succinate dehydrogenase / fumarate reductase iron-sulfur subunit
MTATDTSTPTVRFRVTRRDKPDGAPYQQDFDVPYRPNSNVISCLQAIALNPVTAEGRHTSPVVWDCNCLEEVCGACTMVVNGRVRQSCSTLVDELIEEGYGTAEQPITLEPMSKFPVVRDLFVNRQRLFDELKRIKAWVPIDGTHALGAGPTESPEDQDLRYGLSRCMSCGCCLEACPQYTLDNHFAGAAVFGQALYFNMHETGATLKGDRLEAMMEPGGIADCGNAQNCIKVCPKEVPLTEAIATIGRQTTVYAIKRFFVGR